MPWRARTALVLVALATGGAVAGAQTVVVQPEPTTPAVLPKAPRIKPSASGRSVLVRPYPSPNVDVTRAPGTTVVQPHPGQTVTVVPPPG